MSNEVTIYGFVKSKVGVLSQGSPWSRAMLAKLRRAVGKAPGSIPDIWEITLGGSPEDWHSRDGVPTYAENAVGTALTLFAVHQQGKGELMDMGGTNQDGRYARNSLGAAAGRLISPKKENEQSIKRRFDAVATAIDFAELGHHARGLIQLLRGADIPLDYGRFAQDLYQYQFPDGADAVRLRWGQDFYHVQNVSKSGMDTTEKETSDE